MVLLKQFSYFVLKMILYKSFKRKIAQFLSITPLIVARQKII